jgi:hypothetical protein
MKNILKKMMLTLALLESITLMHAQTSVSALDTLPGNVEQLQSGFSLLNRLKITGYIQTQWQKADTIGSPAGFSAGDFKGTDNRFMIRRGRIKFAYSNELSQYVLQFDVTEKGLAIKDAYASFTDPWTKYFTLTGGAFNRPFGYEIEYSSSSRETPERSRIFQTLFNQERDLGAKLTIQAPKTSKWNFIKLDAGLFTGNGLNVETDKYKDFIGHLYANKSFANENLSIGLGASYYNGGWANQSKYTYKMDGASFVKDSIYAIGDKVKRQYYGIEAQLSLNSVIGITTIRGEYLWGTQPGTSKTSGSPIGIWYGDQTYTTTSIFNSTDSTVTSTTKADKLVPSEVYTRNFSGGYIYFVQSIGQTKHELVVKYDWYDPNTDIAGNDIAAGSTYDASTKKLTNSSKTGTADLNYSTIGLGWIYHWNSNVKLTAYYEMVNNETTNAAGLNQSLGTSGVTAVSKNLKDNVFTFRVQYKF